MGLKKVNAPQKTSGKSKKKRSYKIESYSGNPPPVYTSSILESDPNAEKDADILDEARRINMNPDRYRRAVRVLRRRGIRI